MESGSGNTIGGRDLVWKYCTSIEGNKNDTIYNYCGMVIKSDEITWFNFHLSYTDPHSNSKKCTNVPLEVKKEIKQFLFKGIKPKRRKLQILKKFELNCEA